MGRPSLERRPGGAVVSSGASTDVTGPDVHDPDERVEHLVRQAAGYWSGMHTLDMPTAFFRGYLVSAYEAGLAQPTGARTTALSAAIQRAQTAEDRVRELLRTNGQLAASFVVRLDTGAGMIESERLRQVDVKGHTAEHDDGLGMGDLALAAAAYAITAIPGHDGGDLWPWARDDWRPTGDAVRDLVKAGALIAAAIDAELRARARASDAPEG